MQAPNNGALRGPSTRDSGCPSTSRPSSWPMQPRLLGSHASAFAQAPLGGLQVLRERTPGRCLTRPCFKATSTLLSTNADEAEQVLAALTQQHAHDEDAAEHAHAVAVEAEVQPAPPLPPPPFTTLRRVPLAGGTLELVMWEASAVKGQQDRLIRVWTPAGYCKSDAGPAGWPVLYLNDGQNLYDDKLCFSGSSWKAADCAAALIASGTVPPFIIVGIDHSGATRSLDYTPYKPGTGPKGFRKDAESWPGGGVEAYLKRVVEEVMPYARRAFGAAQSPDLVAFGGSSFGGICTLFASMQYPGLFGAALVESPSLWIAEERFLMEDIAQFKGKWPEGMFVGMGGREYSGIRPAKDAAAEREFDGLVAGYAPTLERFIKSQGVTEPGRLMTVVEARHTHNEASWAQRLPQALTHLLGPWWGALASRHPHDLYFFVPRRLRAGQAAALVLNASKSGTLSQAPRIKLVAGFNGWEDKREVLMQPLRQGSTPSSLHLAPLTLPDNAYEMNFAFSDELGQTWDANGGCNFYARVSLISSATVRGPVPPLPSSSTSSSPAPFVTAKGGYQHHYQNLPGRSGEGGEKAVLSVDELARKMKYNLYFTYPQHPVVGRTFTLFLNRCQSHIFRNCPNVKMSYGWNGWETGASWADLKPTQLWRSDAEDWWGVTLQVPDLAEDMHFCFTDNQGNWESNFGNNYQVAISGAPRANAESLVRPRGIDKEERLDHADGHLHVLQLSKRDTGDKTSDRNSKWTEEKTVRVWTPRGYSPESAPEGGWPVLFINDAQNKFECWLAHQGVSWRIGYTASELIARGDVPPFVIVGIDNPGPMRSLNYLPYPPGEGVGGFRGDAARWPGGGVEQYMQRVIYEIMPMVTEKFNLATDPSRVAFGGGSFGGINALYVSMHYPHIFGSVLAESPSLWIAEGRVLEDLWAHKGMLPERIFMGCGTKEYSATRDHVRDDVDALLLHYYHEAARALDSKGMNGGNGRLRFLVEEGAGHHELAWQWRLTGALQFLLGPWKA